MFMEDQFVHELQKVRANSHGIQIELQQKHLVRSFKSLSTTQVSLFD